MTALVGAFVALGAAAQGIVIDDVQAIGDPQPDIDGPNSEVRFDSSLRVTAPTRDLGHAEMSVHYQWAFGGYSRGPVLLPQRELGWSLRLTVQDPARQGFELSVDSRLRGVLGVEGVLAVTDTVLPALDVWIYEQFAQTPRLLSGLSTGAQAINQSDTQFLDSRGSEAVGRYRGTQSFLFYMGPENAAMGLWPNTSQASAWQQFGIATRDFDLAFMNLLPSDVELDDLGHRLRFSVDYAALPVPEPATWMLLVGGMSLVLLRQRRPA